MSNTLFYVHGDPGRTVSSTSHKVSTVTKDSPPGKIQVIYGSCRVPYTRHTDDLQHGQAYLIHDQQYYQPDVARLLQSCSDDEVCTEDYIPCRIRVQTDRIATQAPVSVDSSQPLLDWYTAHSKWRRLRISSYTFDIRWERYRPSNPKQHVTVVDDQVTSVTNTDVVSEYTGTIDDLFTKVHDWIVTDPPMCSVRVTYDSMYGFPQAVSLDPRCDIADEEVSFRISSFEHYMADRTCIMWPWIIVAVACSIILCAVVGYVLSKR